MIRNSLTWRLAWQFAALLTLSTVVVLDLGLPDGDGLELLRARRAGDEEAVARIIKFGIQGSVMAGHEYLGDDEVVSLARYVRSLQGAAKAP